MKKVLFVLSFALASAAFGDGVSEENVGESDVSATLKNSSENIVKDSISLSSAYFEGQYNNKQLAEFELEVLRGLSRLEDFATSNSSDENRAVAKWSLRVFSMWTHFALDTAYHEIGHGLRCKAYGKDYKLGDSNDLSTFNKDENFFKFVAKNFTSFSRKACHYAGGQLTDNEELVVSAGGMNNEVFLAEKISRGLHNRGRLGFSESFAYFFNRLSPIAYASIISEDENIHSQDDPACIGGYYKKLGISAKKNDIALGGLVSLLLSGSTYSIINSVFSQNQDPAPFSFYDFQVPDTFSYVTSKGVSYKLASAYKVRDDFKIIFGAEHVAHGKSTTEVNLGFRKVFDNSFQNAEIEVVTTFGNGFNLEASCSLPITNCLSLNVEAGTYSCKSLLGERHARNAKNGKSRSSDLSVSISYRY